MLKILTLTYELEKLELISFLSSCNLAQLKKEPSFVNRLKLNYELIKILISYKKILKNINEPSLNTFEFTLLLVMRYKLVGLFIKNSSKSSSKNHELNEFLLLTCVSHKIYKDSSNSTVDSIGKSFSKT